MPSLSLVYSSVIGVGRILTDASKVVTSVRQASNPIAKYVVDGYAGRHKYAVAKARDVRSAHSSPITTCFRLHPTGA